MSFIMCGPGALRYVLVSQQIQTLTFPDIMTDTTIALERVLMYQTYRTSMNTYIYYGDHPAFSV